MMISTKLSLPTLALVLIVFTIFTVSLTENLQLADGFASVATSGWKYELNPGESQVGTWTLINSEDKPIYIEFRGENKGSEFFIYEKFVTMEANSKQTFEFIVTIPDDHPDNIMYKVDMYALERAKPPGDSASAVLINYEMVARPVILIGNDPVFTPEPKPVKVEEEPQVEVIKEKISKEDFSAKPEPETIEEKLARITEANLANEKQVDDTFEEEAVPELKVDDNYIEEPVADPEPAATEEGGGCLIATATFGSELAPQVQLLREIRDNQLMGTGSGMAFMSGFNSLYYSFSPTIADMERESPAFKELVKLTITPMLSTLSIMEHAENDSEVLGLGIGVILMNLGMYVGLPTLGLVKLLKVRK